MRRYPSMRIMLLLVGMLVAAACGREQSVASKSAAAYRDAQAKGTPVAGGHDHGSHGATKTSTAVDHSAHAGMDHGAHGAAASTAVDHSAHGGATAHASHGGASSSANAHAGHSAASSPRAAAHAGHAGHSATQHAAPSAHADPHAGHATPAAAAQMDHSRHGATAATPAPALAPPPRSNAEMQRIQPAATLRGDAFDAPAPAAVAEAAKASQGGGHDHDSYVCPMHPEVTSDEPGTCPKCGMALVKKRTQP